MVVRATKTPGIPDIRDDNIAEVLRAIKTTLEVRERRSGDELDGFVRFRDLEDLNLADSDNAGGEGGTGLPVGPTGNPGGSFAPGYNPGTDYTTPPAPTGFMVESGFAALYLSWDGPPYLNHSHTEIWRAQVDDLAQAIMVGTSNSNMYTDPAELDTEYWYWIRFVSMAGVTGPWNSTSGTKGRTGRDIGKVIEYLSTELVNSALWTELSQRIGKIEVDEYIANRSINSKLEVLESRDMLATSRIFELNSVSSSQATRLTVLESHGPSANRTFFTPERPDADVHGIVANVPLIDGDVWYDTDESNRSYRWVGSGWDEFSIASGNKVYHQPNDPASFDGVDWVDIDGRKIIDGDLWYDADDGNHPYRWKGDEFVWKDFSSGDASAEVITLEQTKIGYATLNRTSIHGLGGSVFDNNGLIWNNVPSGDPGYVNSVQNWNATHTDTGNDSMVTWHVGLPFAHATKQVGITSGGSNATVEQNFVAMKQVDTGLLAQYTVKVDLNGNVAGFGLASYLPADQNAPKSKFIINADVFGIGPATPSERWSGRTYQKGDVVKMAGGPTGTVDHVFQSKLANNTGHTPLWGYNGTTPQTTDPWWSDLTARLPFITTTQIQNIDGKDYPPGVWINSANIFDAQIVSAMIGSLVADKITTGTLKATVSVQAGKIFGGAINLGVPVGDPAFGTGFFMGDDGGTPKFFVGSVPNTKFAMWDGVQFTVAGHIHATTAWIGGVLVNDYTIHNAGVNWPDGNGFYLDVNGYMRIGSQWPGPRLEWHKDNQTLTIYGTGGTVLFTAGPTSGINWGAIAAPPGTANSSVVLTADGRLVGGGGGNIIVGGEPGSGLQAVRADGGNAPPNIRNNQVNISRDPANGGIILSNAGTNSAYGVIMPGYQIRIANAGTYLENMVVSNAYIADAAIGFAEIAGAAIDTAHIRNAAVQSLTIAGEAVTIPRLGAHTSYEVSIGYGPGGTELNPVAQILFGTTIAPIGNFTLTVANTRAIVVIYTAELAFNPQNNNSTFRIACTLRGKSAGTFDRYQYFMFGLHNNQPRFAQTAMFSYENIGPGTYDIHMVACKISGNTTAHNFGNQHVTMFTMMR